MSFSRKPMSLLRKFYQSRSSIRIGISRTRRPLHGTPRWRGRVDADDADLAEALIPRRIDLGVLSRGQAALGFSSTLLRPGAPAPNWLGAEGSSKHPVSPITGWRFADPTHAAIFWQGLAQRRQVSTHSCMSPMLLTDWRTACRSRRTRGRCACDGACRSA